MKNKILSMAVLAALALVTMTSNVNARSWRINDNVTRMADFLDINAACASEEVMYGDTLYLDPGCNLTGEQNVTKQLTIVGPGYFLANQPYNCATINAKLCLRESIKIMGINVENGNIYVYADNVLIERCKAPVIIIGGTSNSNKGQYCTIRQCYVYQIRGGDDASEIKNGYCTIENCLIKCETRCIYDLYNPTIRYNFIENFYSQSSSSQSTVPISRITNGNITNNVVIHTNVTYYNNLFYSLTNCHLTNNLLSCDEGTYPDYPNNTCLGTHERKNINLVMGGINDHEFEMPENSPATVIEAGPFYGPHPYVFSGLPYGHPYYTSVNVSPRAKDGKIHITLNSKVQDE